MGQQQTDPQPRKRFTEKEATAFFGRLFGGEHHIDGIVRPVGEGFEVSTRQSLSTFDFNRLTRFVLLCHEECVRGAIEPSGPGMVKLRIWQRQGREGSLFDRHPTIEAAIADFRKQPAASPRVGFSEAQVREALTDTLVEHTGRELPDEAEVDKVAAILHRRLASLLSEADTLPDVSDIHVGDIPALPAEQPQPASPASELTPMKTVVCEHCGWQGRGWQLVTSNLVDHCPNCHSDELEWEPVAPAKEEAPQPSFPQQLINDLREEWKKAGPFKRYAIQEQINALEGQPQPVAPTNLKIEKKGWPEPERRILPAGAPQQGGEPGAILSWRMVEGNVQAGDTVWSFTDGTIRKVAKVEGITVWFDEAYGTSYINVKRVLPIRPALASASPWISTKPDFKEECLVLCANEIRGQWEYALWQVKWISPDNQTYLGWLTADGEEYGDLEDMHADLYLTMPLLPAPPSR